jgi:hypothetical protein
MPSEPNSNRPFCLLPGDICFGAWKEVGLRTVRLHHVGLTFGTDKFISGTFTEDETAAVQTDNKNIQSNIRLQVIRRKRKSCRRGERNSGGYAYYGKLRVFKQAGHGKFVWELASGKETCVLFPA